MYEETRIDQLTVSPEEFAELTGHDLAIVYQYVNHGMPCSHREVPLKQATKWLLNFQERKENSEKLGQQDEAHMTFRKTPFQESPKEKIREEITVIDAIQQSVREIKNRLIALPSKLNPEIEKSGNSLDTARLLENEIIGILIELSKMQLSPKANSF